MTSLGIAEPVLLGRVGHHRFALPLSVVSEVHRAVAVSPLPGAPDAIAGVVDVRGELMPVVDLGRRFGMEPRALRPTDVLIAVEVAGRPVLLAADAATGIDHLDPDRLRDAEDLVPGASYPHAVAGTPHGPLVVHDLSTFLSSEESSQLDRLLRERHEREGDDDV